MKKITRIPASLAGKKNNPLTVQSVVSMLFVLASGNVEAESFLVTPHNQIKAVGWGCYYPTTCSSAGAGSFTVTTPPKHGVLNYVTGTTTIQTGSCAGKEIPAAFAYYTWTDDQSNSEQDDFALQWKATTSCTRNNSIQVIKTTSPKNQGKADPDCPKTCDGNPINAATGNKFQVETDFVGAPHTGLEIRRFYNSQNSTETTLGTGWRSTWQQSITTSTEQNVVQVTRDDGRVERFTKNAAGAWQADPDVTNQLSVLVDGSNQQTGWQLLISDDTTEIFSLDGRLTSVTNRAGLTTSLSYDSKNRLSTVTGHFGHSLTYVYGANNRISTITTPDGGVYSYSYDAKNNLTSVTYPDKTVRQYVYENSTFTHILTGIIDENGKRFATWTYDALGRATSSQHAGGAELTKVAYNPDGTATVTDALGNQHSYNFTTQFDVVKPTDVTGAAFKNLGAKAFTYDANGFVASQTDFNGNVTTFLRDARGLETSRTEAAGTALARTISTSWHSNFRLPTQITEPNRVTTYSYHNNGNLTERTVTAGNDSRTWAYTYNSAGQVLAVDGPRTDVNDVTHYAYDAKGGLQSITDALGHVTQITAYDANGLPLSVKDANGLVSKLAYDARGRVLSKQVGNELTQYTYDAVGQVTKTIAPDGSVIAFSYDAAHRLLKITDQSGNHIDYTLDANGNRLKQSVYDPKAKLTQTLSNNFDSLNRLATMVGAEGQTTAYFYDDNDNPVALTDPLNNKTAWSYDALNRLASSIDAAGKSTQTTYDANDNLLSVADPLTHKTQYSVDGLGNQLTITSPDTGTSQSSFDSAGNKISSIDARGKQGDFNYDALNRAKTLRYGDQSISFFYDQGANGIGHLTQMGDNSGGTRWTYDSHGRVTSKTFSAGPLSLVTRYGYDGSGRLSAMTYPSGKVVQLTYTNGLVTALDANGKTLVSDIHYQPFGLPADWLFGNGVKTMREFNLDGRMIAYDLGDRSRQLTIDAAGQITGYQDTDMNHDQNFTYDALSRLIGFSTPSTQIDYSYDANGNRTNKTAGGNTEAFTLDTESNRLLGISNNAAPTQTYRYDDAGNVISDGVNSFTYDDRGRLIKASGGFGAEQYLINGLGQRVGKVKGSAVDRSGDANQDGTLNATDLRLIVLMTKGSAPVNLAADCNHDNKITAADATCTQTKMADMRVNPGKYVQTGTYFVYDEAGHLIGEYNQQGTAIHETVWLGDMPVAVMADAKNLFIYADHLNAPRAIADELGKVVWRWDSEAFGKTLANEDPDQDGKAFSYNLRFPGQYFDQSTGLHYNGFRDYDPAIGRYIQSDPIGLNGGLNTYGYVGGNPVGLVDSLGLAGAVINLFDPVLDRQLYNAIETLRPFVKDGEVLIGAHAGSTTGIGNPGIYRRNSKGVEELVPMNEIAKLLNAADPSGTALVRVNACNAGKDPGNGGMSVARQLQAIGISRSIDAPNGFYNSNNQVNDIIDRTTGKKVDFMHLNGSQLNPSNVRVPAGRTLLLPRPFIGGLGGLGG